MKILKIFAASLVSLVIASEAIATPFVWTIPQTTMDDGSTISGSFTYDAAVTPPLSAVNIVKTAPNSQIYNIVGASDAFYIRAAAAVGNSVPAIYININGIPANGGTLTKANGTIGIGLCKADSSTRCNKDEPGDGWLRMSRHHGHSNRQVQVARCTSTSAEKNDTKFTAS